MNTITLDSEVAVSRVIERLSANWKQHAKRGRALVVTIEHSEQPRTEKQLRRCWKLLRYIAEHAEVDGKRYSAEHWDEFYRRLFIGTDECDGERVALGSSELSVGEYNDYMRQIEFHAASELGVEMDGMN